jgi:hypothetical protein
MRSNKVTTLPDTYDKALLDGLDQRSRVAKLLRERYAALTNDQGGLGQLSYQRRSLCWRFVHLEAWIEGQERMLAESKTIDESRYLAALNSYTGLLGRLGLDRRARPVQPLSEYLKERTA